MKRDKHMNSATNSVVHHQHFRKLRLRYVQERTVSSSANLKYSLEDKNTPYFSFEPFQDPIPILSYPKVFESTKNDVIFIIIINSITVGYSKKCKSILCLASISKSAAIFCTSPLLLLAHL